MASLLRELGYENAADPSTVNWVVSHPEIEILIAVEAQDRPIGMLSLSHRPQLRTRGRVATIDELIVTESWRRKGVGRALLAKAVERARSLALKRLDLFSHAGGGGEDVKAFCEACGFSPADSRVFRHAALDFQK